MKPLLRSLVLLVALAVGGRLGAAEHIPPAPAQYFNDYAGVVSPAVVQVLNGKLEQFEKDSSNQLVVAIFPRMESDSSVEDYTVRVAQSWHAGQKKKDNGAVLFVFMQEHQAYIQVGYGLEAVLPDATAKRIIDDEIVPRFRQKDIDGGMSAAVTAMIAATKGEYKGNGHTHAHDASQPHIVSDQWGFIALFLFLILLSSFARRRNRRGFVIGGSPGGWWIPPSGGGGNSGGWNSGGGGGGFSGGGGSFGGGGAGGKW